MSPKILVPRMQKPEALTTTMTANVELLSRSSAGRKRKLDHLSYEEKVQRKKLKNRVAAQTSRDRKKRQVEDMAETIEKQAKKISSLERDNKLLQAKYDKLEREFQKLKATKQQKQHQQQQQQHHEISHSIPEEHKYNRIAIDDEEMTEKDICAGSVHIKSEGPAVSIFKPLPKVSQMCSESTEKSSKKFHHQMALLQIIMLCLFCKNSSKTSTLKKLQMTCSTISTQALKQMMLKLPRYKAMNAHCLDQWWGAHNQQWNPPKIEIATQ